MGEARVGGGPRLHVWVEESVCKRRRGGSVAQHLELMSCSFDNPPLQVRCLTTSLDPVRC